jgi:hypothetical protein
LAVPANKETAIDRASGLAAYAQGMNKTKFATSPSNSSMAAIYPLNISIIVGATEVTVEITRMNELPGDFVVDFIRTASGQYGAARTGVKSTGGLYANFTDA